MNLALSITNAIDGFSRRVGIIAIYLVFVASFVSAANALLRYTATGLLWLESHVGGGVFNSLFQIYQANSNIMANSLQLLLAGIVMLGGAWTYKVNEHVRVDLLYGWVSEKTRTWIDLLGGIFFLLPMCIVMVWLTAPWAYDSFITGEGSKDAGGLVRWPIKFIVFSGFVLMLLQGISEIIKCVLALTTNYVREYAYEKPLQ